VTGIFYSNTESSCICI